ncbi:MAG: type 3 dihydrofolate reductase [Cocleimonas sp.]|nr:type 3 dihydrofolate reductase [Cocleimonas sp.]
MKISMIAAMAHQRVIGKNQKMPWHFPADLAFFKKTTLGSPIVMGRKTYESIGRPLPKRLNIVVTRNLDLTIAGCEVVTSLDQAIAIAKEKSPYSDEIFITGGSHLYKSFLPQADRLYLTLIDATLEGDTFFPDYTQYQWDQVERIDHQADEKNSYPYSFVTLDKATPIASNSPIKPNL